MADRREVVLATPRLELAPAVLELGTDQRGRLDECRLGDPLAIEAVEDVMPGFPRRFADRPARSAEDERGKDGVRESAGHRRSDRLDGAR